MQYLLRMYLFHFGQNRLVLFYIYIMIHSYSIHKNKLTTEKIVNVGREREAFINFYKLYKCD